MVDRKQSLPGAQIGVQGPVKPEPDPEEVRVPWEIETRVFLEPEEEFKSQSNLSQGQRAFLEPEEEYKSFSASRAMEAALPMMQPSYGRPDDLDRPGAGVRG